VKNRREAVVPKEFVEASSIEEVKFLEVEPGVAFIMGEVFRASKLEVIDAYHKAALTQKTIYEVAADKAGSAGDQDGFFRCAQSGIIQRQ
jgi:hypothetical protein